jgi:hypothetical protein
MGLVDDVRLRGASSRITEEALYAEALREVEAGLRRDGLWAKALAETGMRQLDAQACYLKLRVQSLRDEIDLVVQDAARETRQKQQLLLEQSKAVSAALRLERDRPVQGRSDWGNVLVGTTLVGAVIALVMKMFG